MREKSSINTCGVYNILFHIGNNRGCFWIKWINFSKYFLKKFKNIKIVVQKFRSLFPNTLMTINFNLKYIWKKYFIKLGSFEPPSSHTYKKFVSIINKKKTPVFSCTMTLANIFINVFLEKKNCLRSWIILYIIN